MSLTPGTYTPPTTHSHMDIAITPATLAAGTLYQRFDVVAFPKLGKKNTGTDSEGHAVPKAARTTKGAGS